jgi:hypothetical protein
MAGMEIPREADANWPDTVKALQKAWWEKRIAREKEIDASIATKAEVEYLYDKPYTDSSRVRVAGPFTVETLSPHRVLAVTDEDKLSGTLDAAEGRRPPPERWADEAEFEVTLLAEGGEGRLVGNAAPSGDSPRKGNTGCGRPAHRHPGEKSLLEGGRRRIKPAGAGRVSALFCNSMRGECPR